MQFNITRRKIKVLKPQGLIEMKNSLTPSQNDVMDILLSIINKDTDDDEDVTYFLDASKYIAMFPQFDSPKYVYRHIRDGIHSMKSLSFEVASSDKKKGGWFMPFASECWDDEQKGIQLSLTPEFKKYLVHELKTKKALTFYELENQLILDGKFSKRLYPMLCRYADTGTRYDSIDDLRQKLVIPSSYNDSKIKTRVIEPSVEEINKKTDIIVNVDYKYRTTRGGKAIETIVFYIKRKSKKIAKKEKTAPGTSVMEKEFLKVLDTSIFAQEEETVKVDIQNACKERGVSPEELKAYVEYTKEHSKSNRTGYVISLINKKPSIENLKVKDNPGKLNQREYDWDDFEKILLNTNPKNN